MTQVKSFVLLMPLVQQYLTETSWTMSLPALSQICMCILTYSL